MNVKPSPVWFALWLFLGCGPSAPPRTAEIEPVTLLAPITCPYDFSLDQQVTIRHRRGTQSFRAVVEKEGNDLTMVAFAPHGGVGFSIASRRAGFADANVEFHSNLPEALPFEPDWILFDVERAWFVFGTPPSDGNGQTETPYWEDVNVIETWRDHRLIRRSFVRNGTPDTDIEYEPGLTLTTLGLTALPTLVRLTNHRFEYTIELSAISSAADPTIGDGR